MLYWNFVCKWNNYNAMYCALQYYTVLAFRWYVFSTFPEIVLHFPGGFFALPRKFFSQTAALVVKYSCPTVPLPALRPCFGYNTLFRCPLFRWFEVKASKSIWDIRPRFTRQSVRHLLNLAHEKLFNWWMYCMDRWKGT